MILARTYYQSIPAELREASAIDGANEIQHFFKIMMPVCKPIIAVLALWSFVGMWNSYFDAMIYLNDANLQPLQLVLRSILVQNTPQPGMIADIQSTADDGKGSRTVEICNNCSIKFTTFSDVSIFPEIF